MTTMYHLTLLFILFIYVNIFFYFGLKFKKYSVIDIAWPLGFLITSFYSQSIALPFVFLWSLRLGFYLGKRNIFNGEDPRYAKYRILWGEKANRNAYFKIFIFQGLLMFLFSMPLIFGLKMNEHYSVINYFGMLFFFAGFLLESYSDYYLSNFKKKHPTKLCLYGPWKYCRFPNYLGEIILWYGIYLITYSSHSWWTITPIILFNILIIKLTGIAPIEEKYCKIQEYRDYAKKTPRLIFIKPLS